MNTSTSLFGLVLAGALAAVLAPSAARADDGHDHGPAAPAAAAESALPRFSASSDLFELVGVVKGQALTVYLDRADSNEPVKAAQVELRLDDARVDLKEHEPGAFEGTLAHPLKTGVTAVTATVSAGGEADVLAGEIDLHDDVHAAPPRDRRLLKAAAAAAAMAAVLILLIVFVRRRAAPRRAA